MPRLNNEHYIWRHDFLTVVAGHEPTLLLAFSPQQQWQLHRYYATGQPVTTAELLEYRAALDKQNRSLGARAGKLFVQMLRLFDYICELYGEDAVSEGWAIEDFMRRSQSPHVMKSDERYRISGLVRPQPDLSKLARAVMQLARSQADQEQRDQEESDAA